MQDVGADDAKSGSIAQQSEPELGFIGNMFVNSVVLVAVAGIGTVAAARKLSRFPRLW